MAGKKKATTGKTRKAAKKNGRPARAGLGKGARGEKRAGKVGGGGGGALVEFCRGLPGTTEDVKWGDDLVFSVGPAGGSKAGAKMYAAFDADNPEGGGLGFKCTEEDFDRLTDIPGVVPAPYAARFGWVKLERAGVLPRAELEGLIRKSHGLVLAGLPARVRRAVEGTSG